MPDDRGITNGYPVNQVIDGNVTVIDPYGAGQYGHVATGPLAGRIPELVAAVPAGFTLQNGTPTIASWTAPNDGQMHRVTVYGSLFCSVAMTGGAISLVYTDMGGNVNTTQIWGGSFGTGPQASTSKTVTCKPGTTVSLIQSSALTLGAAVAWPELWAS